MKVGDKIKKVGIKKKKEKKTVKNNKNKNKDGIKQGNAESKK